VEYDVLGLRSDGGYAELISVPLVAAAPLLFDGLVTPVIDEVFPLARAADAQRRLEDKEQFGKIVLVD
jgi:D-arabinose 1-dehydrogenase-like Zn-dependent alcohol dehydrogenase